MQFISNALAASLLVAAIGLAPAQAAPVSAPVLKTEFGQLDVEQVGSRGKRDDDDDGRHRWRDDDDRYDRDRRRHARPRCHTEWVVAFSRRGPVWYPVRVCHKRRHW